MEYAQIAGPYPPADRTRVRATMAADAVRRKDRSVVEGAWHAAVVGLRRRDEILQVAAQLIATSGLRTSLQQISEAADIQLGSLYHHFRSKDDILIELLRRYHAEMDRIGEEAQDLLDQPDYRPDCQRIVELGTAVADAGVRHRAALQLTFYEAPSVNPELIELVRQPPAPLRHAMLDTLRALRWTNRLRPGLDLPVVADRLIQTMLHVGLDVVGTQAPVEKAVEVHGAICLRGLAAEPVDDERLDASAAFVAADAVVRLWADQPEPEPADTARQVRAAARAEFARRGFETTTLRDIAAAAGVGLGTVHRMLGSKDDVLVEIMRTLGERVATGWASVFQSDSTVVEKLDAMMWIVINTLYHFPDEFKIQLAWLRQSPPDIPDPGWSFTQQIHELTGLLTRGIDAGEVRRSGSATELLARCVIDVMWIPENILTELGTRDALLLARDTVLRGIAVR